MFSTLFLIIKQTFFKWKVISFFSLHSFLYQYVRHPFPWNPIKTMSFHKIVCTEWENSLIKSDKNLFMDSKTLTFFVGSWLRTWLEFNYLSLSFVILCLFHSFGSLSISFFSICLSLFFLFPFLYLLLCISLCLSLSFSLLSLSLSLCPLFFFSLLSSILKKHLFLPVEFCSLIMFWCTWSATHY